MVAKQEMLEMWKDYFEELLNGTAEQYNEEEGGRKNVQESRETWKEKDENSSTLTIVHALSKNGYFSCPTPVLGISIHKLSFLFLAI